MDERQLLRYNVANSRLYGYVTSSDKMCILWKTLRRSSSNILNFIFPFLKYNIIRLVTFNGFLIYLYNIFFLIYESLTDIKDDLLFPLNKKNIDLIVSKIYLLF